jgi:hypothetical protein
VAKLRRSSVQNWFASFLQALTETRHPTPRIAASRNGTAPILVDLSGTARSARGY